MLINHILHTVLLRNLFSNTMFKTDTLACPLEVNQIPDLAPDNSSACIAVTIVRGAGLTNEGASCCSPKLEAGHLIRIITSTQSRHRGYLSWTDTTIVRNIDQDGDWGGAPAASLALLLFLGYYFDSQASNHGRVGTLIRN